MEVNFDKETLPFCSEPKYLEVTMGRTLTYRRHRDSLRTSWHHASHCSGGLLGAGATMLRTSTLALVHSTAEYCVSAWCRSAHTCLIDPVINEALQTVNGWLLLNGPRLRWVFATLSYTSGHSSYPRRNPTCWASSQRNHIVSSTPCHWVWTSAPLSSYPFTAWQGTASQIETPAAQQLISSYDDNNRSAAFWTDHRWNAESLENTTRFRTFPPDIGTHPPGMSLPKTAWVRFNRLRTGVGRFRSCLHKWGMAPSAACECGAEEQIVDHVVLHCPIHRPPHEVHGLTVLHGRWINRMVAQHQSRDLVRPSSW